MNEQIHSLYHEFKFLDHVLFLYKCLNELRIYIFGFLHTGRLNIGFGLGNGGGGPVGE